jgi:glycerate kinase
MKILLAPDSFKGSLSATSVAKALAAGIESVGAHHSVVSTPLADGGEGSLDVVLRAGFERRTLEVVDSWGQPCEASYGVKGDHVFIEAAEAFGFRPGATPEQACSASSFGVGLVINDALTTHPSIVTLGIGGTSGTDGGVGMATALGWQFLTADKVPVPPGGAGLSAIAHVEPPAQTDRWDGVVWQVLTDVVNPLVGEAGAARVFAPQKGADAASVELLEQGLSHVASVVDPRLADMPGTGAGGGLAYGAMAFLGASQSSGAETLLELSGAAEALTTVDVVVTGEGSFDSQSLSGKITGVVIEQALAVGVRVVVVCGVSTLVEPPEGVEVWQLVEVARDHTDAMTRASELLTQMGQRLAHTFGAE